MSFQFGADDPLRSYDINAFLGVDFTTAPMSVSPNRSPDAKNVVAGKNGMLRSRYGYDLLGDLKKLDIAELADVTAEELPVWNVFFYKTYALIHAGHFLICARTDRDTFGDTFYDYKILLEGVESTRSCQFLFGDFHYFLDGAQMYVLFEDPERNEEQEMTYTLTAKTAAEFIEYNLKNPDKKLYAKTTIPTTVISAAPTGGGTAYEDVNLLTPWRTNRFCADGEATEFRLDGEIDLSIHPIVKVLNSDSGEWETWEDFIPRNDDAGGFLDFTEEGGIPPAAVNQIDNVEVTFMAKRQEEEPIHLCRIVGFYGLYGNTNCVFYTGCPDKPNTDWHSAAENPLYVSDLSYTVVGEEDGAILGYHNLPDGTMAILKEKRAGRSAIYYRNNAMDEDGNVIFPLTAGPPGVGAVSPSGFATFGTDPLFLGNDGIYALVSVENKAENEKYAQSRSYYIDARLYPEEEGRYLFYEHQNMLYVADTVSKAGVMYVADARNKIYENNAFSESYQYEWYYWDNVPANCMFSYRYNSTFLETPGGTALCFGTKDGKLMRFNGTGYKVFADFDENNYPSRDFAGYGKNGNAVYEPFSCYWMTPVLDLGTRQYHKTLRNLFVTVAPFYHSGLYISYFIKSVEQMRKLKQFYLFDFYYVDFDDFSFDTDQNPRVLVTNRKRKKFLLIQFRFEAGEGKPFSVSGLSVQYKIATKYKGV